MSLFKVLIISWLTGVSLSYFKDANVEYSAKCIAMSFFYLFSSFICYKLYLKPLKSNNNLHLYMISLLCICMIISSWFNLLFSNPDIYYALINIKQGDGLSWKLVYQIVELFALFIVGRDALIFVFRWFDCRRRRLRAIIENTSIFNRGR